jgi:hypothetical protein
MRLISDDIRLLNLALRPWHEHRPLQGGRAHEIQQTADAPGYLTVQFLTDTVIVDAFNQSTIRLSSADSEQPAEVLRWPADQPSFHHLPQRPAQFIPDKDELLCALLVLDREAGRHLRWQDGDGAPMSLEPGMWPWIRVIGSHAGQWPDIRVTDGSVIVEAANDMHVMAWGTQGIGGTA